MMVMWASTSAMTGYKSEKSASTSISVKPASMKATSGYRKVRSANNSAKWDCKKSILRISGNWASIPWGCMKAT